MPSDMQRMVAALERLAAATKGRDDGRSLLLKMVDGATQPYELLHHSEIALALFNWGERRFEIQRTPNLFPAFSTAGVQAETSLTDAVTPANLLTPTDNHYWRILAGIVSSSVNAVVSLKEGKGGRIFFRGNLLAGTPVPFIIPGNGFPTNKGAIIAGVASVAAVLDGILYVSDESLSAEQGVSVS